MADEKAARKFPSLVALLGCGFLGKATAHFFQQKGSSIRASSTSEEGVHRLKGSGVDEAWLINSHTSLRVLSHFLEGTSLLVIAVAPSRKALYSHAPSEREKCYKETYITTLEKVSAALSMTRQAPEACVYISSTSVYGDHGGAYVDEDSPYQNPSPSIVQHHILRQAEKIALSFGSKTKTTILRIGELTGGSSGERSLIERARRLSHTLQPGKGDSISNLSHVQDVVSAIDFAYRHSLEGIYNVVGDIHVPRKELYTYLSQQYSFPPPQWDPTLPHASPHAGSKIVVSRKIRERGFRFSHALYPCIDGDKSSLYQRGAT